MVSTIIDSAMASPGTSKFKQTTVDTLVRSNTATHEAAKYSVPLHTVTVREAMPLMSGRS